MRLIDLFTNKYPYSDFHEMNLDWLISDMNELSAKVDNFTTYNTVTFADPVTWNITRQYQANKIVIDVQGNAYMSKQPVPAGIAITNTDYWLLVFDFVTYVETANKNLTDNIETDTDVATHNYTVGDWLILDNVLYRVIDSITTGDTFSDANIIHFTVEQFLDDFVTSVNTSVTEFENTVNNTVMQYKNDIDASELAYKNEMQDEIDRLIGQATADSEVINARKGSDNNTYTVLRDAINTQFLSCALSADTQKFYPVWNRQNVDANLNIESSTTRCLTDAFEGGILHISFESGYLIKIVQCDASDDPIAVSTEISTSPFKCVSSDNVRILIRKSDNSSIDAGDAADNISVSLCQVHNDHIKEFEEDVTGLAYYLIPQWTREAYDNSNTIVSSTSRCLSEVIHGSDVYVDCDTSYDIIPVWVDDNGDFVAREHAWITGGKYIIKGVTDNLRIMIRKHDNSSLPAYIPFGVIRITTLSSFKDAAIGGIDLINKNNLVEPLIPFEGGAIGNNGTDTDPVSTRARTGYVISDHIEVTLNDSDYVYQIVVYNTDDEMIYKSDGWQTDPVIFNLHGYKTRFVVAKANNSKLTALEAKQAITIKCSLPEDYFKSYDTTQTQNMLSSGQIIEHSTITPLKIGSYIDNVPFAAFTKNGVLIVGCDVRMGTGQDTEPTEIYVTRSTDGGVTFEPAVKLFAKGDSATNSRVNDATILTSSSGRVFVFAHWCDSDQAWQTMSDDEEMIYRPDFDLLYKYSDDDGATWSSAVSLQHLYINDPDIMTILGGLTAGIEASNGMLILPISCKMKSSNTEMSGSMFRYQCTIIYSTNNGASWSMHTALTPCNSLEPTVVEYEPNKFVMNCRGYIGARRMFNFEYDTDTNMFTDYTLANGDCNIKEPTGHAAQLYKYQKGFRTIGLYGGSFASGNDRGKGAILTTHDYVHFKPVMAIRNVSDSIYGMMCFASFKGHLVVVFASNTRIFITDLDKYVDMILSS